MPANMPSQLYTAVSSSPLSINNFFLKHYLHYLQYLDYLDYIQYFHYLLIYLVKYFHHLIIYSNLSNPTSDSTMSI
jgi:hypothetical protein